MTGQLLATPFHARTAEANRLNAWQNCNGYTLATHYGSVDEEAIAARFGTVLVDLSWLWRVEVSGERAGEFVSRLVTRDAAALGVGAALDALWLNDAGAVRGAGTVLRLEDDRFLLMSSLADPDWLRAAARLYDVEVFDRTAATGLVAVIGPAAQKLLAAIGLDAALPPLAYGRRIWRGTTVAISRLGMGFEIWCDPDDALMVWDRLIAVGRSYAVLPAGLAAFDVLERESGIVRPGRDFAPARDGFSPRPSPQSLGLGGFVDRSHHFNGRTGYLKSGPDGTLAGLLLDRDMPAPETPVTAAGRVVGRVLAACYSPALRAVAVLAIFDVPVPAGELAIGASPARLSGLPLLPTPAPMGATEIVKFGV